MGLEFFLPLPYGELLGVDGGGLKGAEALLEVGVAVIIEAPAIPRLVEAAVAVAIVEAVAEAVGAPIVSARAS